MKFQAMKIAAIFGLILISFVSITHAETNSSTRQFDNFSDNNIDPFEVCTTNAPQFVGVVSKRVKTVWLESGENGGRRSRGAEFCAELRLTSESRFKFNFRLPGKGRGTNGNIRYPSDSIGGIGQIFMTEPNCNTWMVLLSVENNELWVEFRGSCGSAQRQRHQITGNITRNKNHTVEILIDPSNNSTGSFQLLYDGSSKVNETGINLGFADSSLWNQNDNMSGGYMTAKCGQYNYDFEDYVNNEQRTVYYDKVTWEKD